MTDTLFKEVHYSLDGFIGEIGLGRIGRPDIRMRQLDMTNDNGLFFDAPARSSLPAYVTKMIDHFNRWSSYAADGSGDVSIAQ